MDFPEGQHHFAEGQHLHMSERKKTQTFPLKDKRESDFPKKLHHFAKGEKKMRKKFCDPDVVQSFHDLEGNKKPLSHFSSGDHIYEGMLSFSPHAPLQYFLLPDEADFFSFLLNFKCRQWCFQQVIQLI